MEAMFAAHIQEISASPKVKGVLAIDKQGLCIAANGILTEKDAGTISAIVRAAGTLESESDSPLISIKYEKKDLLIYRSAGVILAVMRSKEN